MDENGFIIVRKIGPHLDKGCGWQLSPVQELYSLLTSQLTLNNTELQFFQMCLPPYTCIYILICCVFGIKYNLEYGLRRLVCKQSGLNARDVSAHLVQVRICWDGERETGIDRENGIETQRAGIGLQSGAERVAGGDLGGVSPPAACYDPSVSVMQGTRRKAPSQQTDGAVVGSHHSSPGLPPVSVDSLTLEVYEASTPEHKRAQRKESKSLVKSHNRKADPRDSNGNNSENIGFIPGSAEIAEDSSVCESCGLGTCVTWQTVKAVFCCVVTCGICKADPGSYNPCSRTTESSTDVKVTETANLRYVSNPTHGITLTCDPNPSKKTNLAGNSFNYYDIKLRGEEVIWTRTVAVCPGRVARTCTSTILRIGEPRQHIAKLSQTSSDEFHSFLEEDLENNELNGSMSSAELDEYINKKLLELFSIHQIDMLAQCTSDTTFISKSSEISELIDSITKGYKINEKDAECRIVTGIVRISTRKPKKKRSPQEPSEERLVSLTSTDAKPQTETFLPSDELNLEISVVDPLDLKARQLQGLTIPELRKDDSLQDTETDSSGAPLLKVYL
ncbi:LOW QUALITY PROTEIN: keratinocyte differentiation factor 1-like [Pristis pectinata]|uniref:LOW QUALITY PROTEIN: keratinocyte differentiation factor 1-like n=1 Tax=Pristis pectinata TaxID=685728 RepID=UPI00223CF4EF|nr:LOW QUALITY PROTEIN: keratinocyte differentiation factor 1-like [Pristis pectinata]